MNNQNNGNNNFVRPVMPPKAAPVSPSVVPNQSQAASNGVKPVVLENTNQSLQTGGIVVAPPSSEAVNASNKMTATVSNQAIQNGFNQQVVAPQVVASKVVTPNQVATPPVPPVPPVTNAKAQEKPKKKKGGFSSLLLIIILLLAGYIVFSTYKHKIDMNNAYNLCTPVSTKKEAKKLDLNSTIVRSLYSKVETNIKEDVYVTLNDELKLYLAYRQLPRNKFYESNCKGFDINLMEPFTCKESSTFTPLAFKANDLQIELKELFGENSKIELNNIQLNNSCIGGYQYIKERGEFVQGECGQINANIYKKDKKLIDATSKESTITLREEVKYYGSEGNPLPDALKSGVYVYTFRLDPNYNYVLISKELEAK